MLRRARPILLAAALLASDGGRARAEAPAPRASAVERAADELVRKIAGLGGTVGVSVVDTATKAVVVERGATTPLNPASNAKLLTASAALARLGPGHRFHTVVTGRRKGDRATEVVLRGTGDPSLDAGDVHELAREIARAGVARVEGDLSVDQGFFDDAFVPPAFDQQPGEWAPFRAPIAAVSVDENTVTLVVQPGEDGGPARVSFDPPGFVDVTGEVRTGRRGTAESVTLELSPSVDRLAAKVGGAVPAGSRVLRFTRRVHDPRLLAGYVLAHALSEVGVAFSGKVKLGEAKRGAEPLAQHRSRPLGALLFELGKQSDNFYAEMVFAALALEEKGKPAGASAAATVVTEHLSRLGALDEGTVIKNGSGLFDADRVTPRGLTKLLVAQREDPRTAADFEAELAIAGVDGTLRHRLADPATKGLVRAKTGTLDAVAALSGYLHRPGKSSLAFALVANGVPGKAPVARAAIDAFVVELARE